jgi:hypothetical protein
MTVAMTSVTPLANQAETAPSPYRYLLAGSAGLAVVVVLAILAATYAPAWMAYWSYEPQEGDIVFQSLPRSPLVIAIEGASHSPYSHCGLVAKVDGDWVVYEAFRQVEATPLREVLFRGRGQGFAVYRLKPEFQHYIPATTTAIRAYLGRPYDARYRMDDEQIYCSELIYKAYATASGGQKLGELVRLGDLDWQPYQETIERLEGGPTPVEREMIAPRDLARAAQLELVLAHAIEVGR